MTSRASTALAVCVALACTGAQGKPPVPPEQLEVEDVTARDAKLPALPRARITVSDAFGGSHAVEAEVAHQAWSRTRGLMWRTKLDDGAGMIFLFPAEQPLSFWMKNTLISLDMIFITHDWRVAGCVERAEPKTLSPRRVARPSQYVLEVPAGWCQRMGISAGAQVRAEGLQGLQVGED